MVHELTYDFQVVLPLLFCIGWIIYQKCCYKKDDLGRDKAFQEEYIPIEQRRSLPGAELDRDLAETMAKLEKKWWYFMKQDKQDIVETFSNKNSMINYTNIPSNYNTKKSFSNTCIH